jgi:uncharacterized protein (TIGR00251 family)
MWQLRERDGAISFDIVVQPRAARPKIGPMHDGRLKISVTAPPADGEANAAVIELLAKHLGVARGAIEIAAGHTGRRKTLRVHGVPRETLEELARRVGGETE